MHEGHSNFVDLWDGVCVEMDEIYISQQVHDEMHANRRHVGDGFGLMYVFGTHVCVYIIRN